MAIDQEMEKKFKNHLGTINKIIKEVQGLAKIKNDKTDH